MATQKLGFDSFAPSYFKVEETHDGKRFRYAIAHATLTVGTLYAIIVGTSGEAKTAALADNAYPIRVGVATEATTTDNLARLQTGGEYEGLTTPSLSVTDGHTLEIAAGAIADGAAAMPIKDAQQFAVNIGGTTTNADSHDVYLLDREVTPST